MAAYDADVAVIGGSLGGVAAAIAVADAGLDVILTTPTDWVGGQITNQGVSALDEHRHIESFGGTRTYDTFRQQVRAHYRRDHDAPATMPDGRPLNPGNGWVSRLCFEPPVGQAVLRDMLASSGRADRMTILETCSPIDATVADGCIQSLRLDSGADTDDLTATVYLDATEWGDLLPIVDANYVTGAEAKADTHEAHAPPTANPQEIQSFTYCFAVEYRPGEDHTIERPAGYDTFRDEQPYTFDYVDHAGAVDHYRMFEEGPDGERPFWTYRRIVDASILEGFEHDIALINWRGNDYYWDSPIDAAPERQARIEDEAKRLALGLLYWLQTDAPRDDGSGTGYPELKLRRDLMGTEDGLSKQPYVRECRRIIPATRVVEGDIAVASVRGARSRRFPTSVGIGWYGMDLHHCIDAPEKALHEPTRPYQIPVGALVPAAGPTNLLAACKNIGTTHLTNGAYRLHPTEWAIGEAAGTFAADAIIRETSPSAMLESTSAIQRLQYRLLGRGVPIAWTTDVDYDHDLFDVTQLLVAWGAIPRTAPRFDRLTVDLDDPVTNGEVFNAIATAISFRSDAVILPSSTDRRAEASTTLLNRTLAAAEIDPTCGDEPPTWRTLSRAIAQTIRRTVVS